MKVQMETITPAKARRMLESNYEHQRHLRSSHVERLAQQMERGLFDGQNGQTIVLNGSDRLIDGQHRLAAIVQSGKPQKILIVRGASSKAFETIDNIEAARTIENYYEIHGQEHAKVSSQVARWVYNYEHYNGEIIKTPELSPGHLVKWALEHHPEIPESVDEVSKHLSCFQKAHLGTKSHLAFTHYMWRRVAPVEAYVVSAYFGSNEGQVPGTIAQAKQYLINNIPHKSDRLPGNQRIAQVVGMLWVSWNAVRSGDSALKQRGLNQRLSKVWDRSAQRKTLVLPPCL